LSDKKGGGTHVAKVKQTLDPRGRRRGEKDEQQHGRGEGEKNGPGQRRKFTSTKGGRIGQWVLPENLLLFPDGIGWDSNYTEVRGLQDKVRKCEFGRLGCRKHS